VVDECHHAPSAGYKSLLDTLQPKFLIGVTATPWRGDNESLRSIFGDPIFSMNIIEGMLGGYLADVNYNMLVDGIDWDQIKELSKQGLTVKDLNRHLYVPERDRGMVSSIVDTIESTKNPRTLVFCRSIDHATRLQQFFKQFDVTVGILHSNLVRNEKFKVLSNFRTGKMRVLLSIEMLNEGIDVPEVNIVAFARVTHSRRIFLQQLGRGLRLSEGKDKVIVLDFVADVRRLAAGIEMNEETIRFKDRFPETVRYPDAEIVHFSSGSGGFFKEYLTDMAGIDDLDEEAILNFPYGS